MKIKIFGTKGFTLVEMLMVVSIILLILSIGNYSYRNQRRQVEFNNTVFQVSSIIKKARNYAVTSRSTYDNRSCRPVGEESFVPPDGYGVYIKRSTDVGQGRFVLFANTKADNDITRNQFDEGAGPMDCEADLIEEEFALNGKAIFTDILTSLTPSTPFSSGSHADENEAVIIFKTALADTTLAANDHPPLTCGISCLTLPLDLYLEFERPQSSAGAVKNYIHINRLAGFPEIITQ